MAFIADFHIHSRFSRACSKDINIKNLEKFARIKGVNVLGTGDFTHPEWFSEIKRELKDEHNTGIYTTNSGFPFVLQVEVSLIYSHLGRGRRVHHVILAPNIEVVSQIRDYFLKKGRLDYDGRPIFNITSEQLVADLRGISDKIELIPAHIWTPWFSLFGSKSGYDSFKDCFGKQSRHVHAIETGISSDPEMNWRVKDLDDKQIVSFSDSHSYWPWRLGREATIFNFKELTYDNIINAIRTGKSLSGTLEADPAYGKYHWDGHRNCGINISPSEARKLNNICPVCKKPLTIGVEHRVEELASRPPGFVRKNAPAFWKLLPLHELISHVTGKGLATKSSWQLYYNLIKNFGSEYDVLLRTSARDLARVVDRDLVNAIILNREQKIKIIPGSDGVYGKIVLDFINKNNDLGNKDPVVLKSENAQKALNDFF